MNATQSVKTVAILPVNAPQAVGVHNMGAGMALGIIGAVVQGNYDQSHTQAYVVALNKLDDRLGTEATQWLAESLAQRGLQVSMLAGQRARRSADNKDDFSGVVTSADVLLVAWFGYTGWWSGTMSKDYHPWIILHTELIDPRTQRVLFRQSYSAFNNPHNTGVKFIDVPETAEYSNFDELMAHVPESVQALRVGERAIIAQLMNDLQLGSGSLQAKSAPGSMGSVMIQPPPGPQDPMAPPIAPPIAPPNAPSVASPSPAHVNLSVQRASENVQPTAVRFQTPTQEFGDGSLASDSPPASPAPIRNNPSESKDEYRFHTPTQEFGAAETATATVTQIASAPASASTAVRQSSASNLLAKNDTQALPSRFQDLADQLAQQSPCHSGAHSELKVTDQGAEIYSALCASGDRSLIRCEANSCHEMK